MRNLTEQGAALRELLRERILRLGRGHGHDVAAAKPLRGRFRGCPSGRLQRAPRVHQTGGRSLDSTKYLEAGSDIIETNTFGATSIVLAEYQLQDRAFELNRTAAQLARSAADKFSTPSKPRLVAGAMSPTTKAITRRRP